MKGLLVPAALAVAVASGCSGAAPAGDPTARTASPIQGGTADTTHDFAVAVFLDLGGGEGAMCSGVLLAPNLVATARHCVSQLSSPTVDCTSSTFGALYATSQYTVTNSAVFDRTAVQYKVSTIVVPTGSDQDKVCGNDIALLVLATNVSIAQYAEPVISPPMTDHSTWATTVAAIGYGIDTPTDTTGVTAGTRRIREDVALACIPNDTTFTDCYADPSARSILESDEFESGNATCEGDSGSGAFDQTQLDAGHAATFGILSRGTVSSDGTTCESAVYSRFDRWSSLLVEAATQASQAGGYPLPTWAVDAESAGDAGAEASAGTSGGGKGGGCNVAVAGDPGWPGPWRIAAMILGAAAFARARRRRAGAVRAARAVGALVRRGARVRVPTARET
jgi:MYXO-CTERM domain-containing protein